MWTKVSKPSSSNYTPSNPLGREQYDQATIIYDSPTTFYDGVNQGAWSKVSKPATSNWIKISKPT